MKVKVIFYSMYGHVYRMAEEMKALRMLMVQMSNCCKFRS